VIGASIPHTIVSAYGTLRGNVISPATLSTMFSRSCDVTLGRADQGFLLSCVFIGKPINIHFRFWFLGFKDSTYSLHVPP